MLRIARSDNGGHPVIALSGRIEESDVPELQKLLTGVSQVTDITLDLEELRLVDRQVVKFLAACEAQGIRLKNCPTYVRQWMATGASKP